MKNLPCGRTTDDILQKLDEAPSLHELECRWCHQERRRLKDQDAKMLSQLRASSSAENTPDFMRNVLDKISNLRPLQRSWDAASPETRQPVRVSSTEIITRIRAEFAESRKTQLNYTEVRATDTSIPHTMWLIRCTVSMLTRSTVHEIEQEILTHVNAGLNSMVASDHLTVEITVEDVHGEVLVRSEIQA
ncbi:hypothetical protein [Glutamicibacter sp.]|uniref:hypothetical protein n=1 Tax=Glutamicibacter sp. TaxID=1931995 RepID=UPI002B47B8A3|nr:hypothetical protein [Glutamicibacter sp.]HJX76693.1 hypothetical protein [Glutamicibacter sp.]